MGCEGANLASLARSLVRASFYIQGTYVQNIPIVQGKVVNNLQMEVNIPG
jgi:hypothetical protein